MSCGPMDEYGEITIPLANATKFGTLKICVIFARRSLDGDCFRIASLAQAFGSIAEEVLLLQLMCLALLGDCAPNKLRPQFHVAGAC